MKTVTVIGGGIAGLQAGVFTAKAGEQTLLLDTGESLVHNTSNIQNLIGHDSVSGQELLKSGKNKLEDFDGEIKEEEVEKVEKTEDGFRIKTSEDEYESEYVIVASAGDLSYLENLDLEYQEGVEGPYMMDRHIKTDDSNESTDIEKLYVAGLSNSWEYQTSVAIGDGAKAALNLLSDKYGEPYEDHDT
ncbi:MAG: NAD(P)/FAD-dependent oxidoreductase [Nanohaloarchaea archaeon SW_4_43_9]|nr:MAG: NAD(P)/FAD-dependent oxidoreductase [Nanohaloarchaea archaeon SW_4_43_9]